MKEAHLEKRVENLEGAVLGILVSIKGDLSPESIVKIEFVLGEFFNSSKSLGAPFKVGHFNKAEEGSHE